VTPCRQLRRNTCSRRVLASKDHLEDRLKDIPGDQYADDNQHGAGNPIGAPLQPGAEGPANLEAGKREANADDREHNKGRYQRRFRHPEPKPDDEVVDRQREAGHEQGPYLLPGLRHYVVAVCDTITLRAKRLYERPQARRSEHAAADVTRRLPKAVRRAVADEKADNGHRRLKEAKDDGDPKSCARVNAGDADAYCSREIVEANGECTQHKCEHNHGVTISTRS
jgi:hypothetical protein